MKNLKKLFSLLLVAAMLLTSTIALAEEAAADLVMQTITVNDVQISLNDSLLMDLSGLSLSVGGAIDPVTGKGAAQLAVLGGDESAASALAAWNDGKAVLTVDGLSQPLTLDYGALIAQLLSEENWKTMLAQITARLSEEEAAALVELIEACTELFSEENVNSMLDGLDTYLAAVEEITADCITEPAAETYEFSVLGEADAQHIEMNFTPEDITELLKAACAFYDSNPAIIKLLNAAMKLDGEDIVITSYADLLPLEDMPDISVTGDLYVSDDGCDAEAMLTVFEEDDPIVDIFVDVYLDGTNTQVVFTMTDAGGDDFEGISFSLSALPSEEFEGETEISAALFVNEGGEEQSISLWCGPDADFGYMISAAIDDGYDSIGIAAAASDTQFIFTVYDDVTTLEVGYVTEYEGAEVGEGQLYATFDDGYDTFLVTAMVHTTTSTITAAEIDELLAAEGIDVMTINEEDVANLYNEATALLIQAGTTLGQNVPGLASLMGVAEDIVE